MTEKLKLAVVGGDARQAKLCNLLANDGHIVISYALDKAKLSQNVLRGNDISSLSQKFDCVILPVPICSDEKHLNTPLSESEYRIDEIFSLFSPGQTVIGGRIDNSLFTKAGRNGIRLYDYLEREDFTVLNSIATAEGAIEVAMRELETTLNRKKCLVIGFGHIGKLLSAYLRGIGAVVSASARKFGDLAWISAYGYESVETSKISDSLSKYDIIFNTVPALILDEKTLAHVRGDAFICDLASKPGGVDFIAAKELGLHAVHSLSLPGKSSPLSAATAMRDTIYNILDEWGN